ncbi:outer membrane stress sensor protease DegS [Halorhodospira halochloris]|uniref:Outer membrane stress sensor protease DegS n=1 Tax=Halorhodospira halochloris TaxID=1052 RepID=A0A0X8XBH7_HALHR|nr:trypsin-like peptidase domain-containing protein [Halorhodospira halochloris]MBK1651668.1 transcriptional regulator [Halorhodospira halochloris]BAU58532.2 outer membrane stress sensor protease DegS [Halorhodospira halochloris]
MTLPGSKQKPIQPWPYTHYGEWIRFVLGYATLGIAIAIALVWLNPGWLYSVIPQDDSARHEGFNRDMPVETDRDIAARPAQLGQPVSYAESVARAAPAVVNIYSAPSETEQFTPPGYRHPLLERFFEQPGHPPRLPRHQANLGSGIIISENGYIVTNHHVIKQAESIKVVLPDKREARATVIGEDPETDLALLSIDLQELPVISFGDESDVRVGDVVLAIGNPFGVGQTVTKGIISATGRDQLGLSTFESFLQTDAAINVGNSGGALIDAHGRLIGINTALFDRGGGGSHGIGFAIPASMVQSVISDFFEHGQVVRGWLGVKTQRLTPPLARSFDLDESKGVVVTEISPGGPVEGGTLKTGDVLTKIDGTQIESVQDFLRATGRSPPGTRVEVSGYRDGDPFNKKIILGKNPKSDAR